MPPRWSRRKPQTPTSRARRSRRGAQTRSAGHAQRIMAARSFMRRHERGDSRSSRSIVAQNGVRDENVPRNTVRSVRRIIAGAIEHAPAPAVNIELDIGAQAWFGTRLARADQGDVRILRRMKTGCRNRASRGPDRSGAAAAVRAVDTDSAASVQQSPLFGIQRRYFLEDFPCAGRHAPRCGGPPPAVHRKTADHGAERCGARRSTSCAGSPGSFATTPGRRRPSRRARQWRIARAHQLVQPLNAIDLDERLLQFEAHVLPLIHHLRRITRFHQLPFARVAASTTDGYSTTDGSIIARKAATTAPPASCAEASRGNDG